MNEVEHAINRLMRKLEGNQGDLDALETLCSEIRNRKCPTCGHVHFVCKACGYDSWIGE